jgi:hypothetical protein
MMGAALLISFTGPKSPLFDMARAAGTPALPPHPHTHAGTRTCARLRAPERAARTHARMREGLRARARTRVRPFSRCCRMLPLPSPPAESPLPAMWAGRSWAVVRCRRRPQQALLRGILCRRRRPCRDAQPRRARPGGARHNEYSRTHVWVLGVPWREYAWGTRSTHIAAGAALRGGSGGTTGRTAATAVSPSQCACGLCGTGQGPRNGPVPLFRSIAVRVQRLAGWCAEVCVGCMRKCHHPAVRSAAQIPSPTARALVLAPTAQRSTAAA